MHRAVILFALALTAQEPTAPRPIDATESLLASRLQSKLAILEGRMERLAREHADAKRQHEAMTAEYQATLAHLRKKSGADGCELDLDQKWVCPDKPEAKK